GKPWKTYQTIVPKSETAIANLLDQVEQVLKLWNDPANVPQAVQLWAKVQPILLAVLAEGEKNFESSSFATAGAAITKIGKTLGERAAAATAAAAAAAAAARDDAIMKKKPRNDHERLQQLEVEQRHDLDKHRGSAKVHIGLIGAKILQKQYDAM